MLNLFFIHIAFFKDYRLMCILQESKFSLLMFEQFHPGPARKLSTNLYDIYHVQLLSVQ